MEKSMWVVMVGGLSDGFVANGPFDDHDNAVRYGATVNDVWFILPLQKPQPVDVSAVQELNSEPLQQGRAS